MLHSIHDTTETSIIIPVYNEEKYLPTLLDSLLNNDYPTENLKIFIFDGNSTDKTPEILNDYASRFPHICIRTNPKRVQVATLNLALEEIESKYIIRCDAHAQYPPHYISTLVNYLKNSDDTVGNVGGQAVAVAGANTTVAKAIAIALKHPFGVGISHRSITINKPTEVDTLLFGAWKKEILENVGNFDENFIRGQDYEYNKRLISHDYKVLILPNLKFKYFTRTSIIKLSKMIYQYAYAKTQIMKKYKEAPSIRVVIPAIFLLGLLCSIIFSTLLYLYGIYLIIVLGVSMQSSTNIKTTIYLFFVFLLMHISHGFGFLRGLFEQFIFGRSKISFKSTR